MPTPLELLQGGTNIQGSQPVAKSQPTPSIPVVSRTATVAQAPSGNYTQSNDGVSLDPSIVSLAKAIRQHETGNRQIAGSSGEAVSKYQFLPSTWKVAAQKYLGDANAPMTGINEDKVAYYQIKDWKDKGYKPSQIAAAWNAGEGSLQGDRWKQMVGTNDYGVKYDVPSYVNNVLKLYGKERDAYLAKQAQQPQQEQQTPTVSEATQQVLGSGDIGKTLGILSDLGFGAVQQVGKTIMGASSLGERGLTGLLKTLLPKSVEEKLGISQPASQMTTGAENLQAMSKQKGSPLEGVFDYDAQSKAQKVGQVGTEIGSYLIPGTSALKVGKAAETAMIGGKLLKGAAKLGATGATEAVLGTGIAGVQSGKIGTEELGTGTIQGVASLVLPPIFSAIGTGIKTATRPLVNVVKDDISQIVSKAIRPFSAGKPVNLAGYTKKVENVMDTIVRTTNKAELPKDIPSFYNALQGAKKNVWSIVDDIRTKAGNAGLTFEPARVTARLNAISGDLGKTPEVRNKALGMIKEIEELRGLKPDVIQARIQAYNVELAPFFKSGTPASKQTVVAEVSQLLRDELDNQISTVIKNSGNKELLARYSAIKSIEKDLWKQAASELKKSAKNNIGFYDISDIYSNAELFAGLILDSKEAIVKGITGKTTKELLKYLSSGDRFIEKGFANYYKLFEQVGKQKGLMNKVPVKFTPQNAKLPVQNLNLPKLGTGKITTEGVPIPLQAPGRSNLGITEINKLKK